MDHRIGTGTTSKDIDRDLLQPPPLQLPIKTLQTKLRTTILQFLNLPEQALLIRQLLGQRFEDCPMQLHAGPKLLDSLGQRAPFLLKNAIAAPDKFAGCVDHGHAPQATQRAGRSDPAPEL